MGAAQTLNRFPRRMPGPRFKLSGLSVRAGGRASKATCIRVRSGPRHSPGKSEKKPSVQILDRLRRLRLGGLGLGHRGGRGRRRLDHRGGRRGLLLDGLHLDGLGLGLFDRRRLVGEGGGGLLDGRARGLRQRLRTGHGAATVKLHRIGQAHGEATDAAQHQGHDHDLQRQGTFQGRHG
ncbi:hypothetical protein CC_2452 [Caulobacter vibrioides CB15]|uniref:Uncharacterized protein n=1 Tax=Caulobacter vibrioides (strain ATCC 19089 / CIP 103742 / CB 15) TaxID=190650 RepID=Q9A5J5_CAUVC|nr:hypothetical protein CC_2452 [Caulobacter vibrioides CB15]ATC29306.1 hypothetical protein CA607_13290 [Caulobacter vibrioides]